MAQKVTEFVWTKQKEDAVALVADKRTSDDAIAEKVGISRRQLARWKAEPTFEARRKEIVEAWQRSVEDRFLASKHGRIESYIADFEATETILKERGEQLWSDQEAQSTPYSGGARTGYIVRDYKGKDADVAVYAFDAALFRERRAIREQIADELGQLVKRTEHTGANGGPLAIMITPADERL